MRAARLHRPATAGSGPDVRVDTLPTPQPGPAQVLVEVWACGICTEDLQVARGELAEDEGLPRILGHEAAGVVGSVGADVAGWQEGDRVALLRNRPCGTCGHCRAGRHSICPDGAVPGIDVDGVQASHAVGDPRFLAPVPVGVPLDHAALVTDAVATPYHALKRGGVGAGVTCAVFGLGSWGLHAVQLARLAGATVIGVGEAGGLDRARDWGADGAAPLAGEGTATRVRELSEGGVDRALVLSGDPEVAGQAVESLEPGGRATLVGPAAQAPHLPSPASLARRELEVVGSVGSTSQDLGEVMDLLEAGRLDLSRSVAGVVDLEDVPATLSRLVGSGEDGGRVVVRHDDR